MNNDTMLSRNEAAEYIGVHLNTIKKLMYEGDIEYIKIGKAVRIRKSEIDEYLQRNTVTKGR